MNILRAAAVFLLLVSAALAGDELCNICVCKKVGGRRILESITCQTTNRKLFEDDVEWPKKVKRIQVIEFRDMISAVLPM